MKIKGLYRKTDSGIYYYQPPQIKGHRPKPISLGTKDRDAAIERYLEVNQAQASLFRDAALGFEVGRFHREKARAGRHTAESSKSSGYVLGQMVGHLGAGRNIASITTADLAAWQDSLQTRINPGSVRTYFGRVSSFFAWAVRERLTASNPVDRLELPKTVRSRSERYCTRDERELLLGTIPEGRDDLAFFLHVGFFAGLRPGEIIEMRPGWIDLGAGTITVQNTDTFTVKDKRHRVVRISPRLADFLGGYGLRAPFMLRPDKTHGKVARNPRKKAWKYRYDPRRPFKDHVRAAGLDWVNFYTLRHTFATLHALAGTPLTTIARELGDDERTTFRNYVGYSRQGEHAGAID